MPVSSLIPAIVGSIIESVIEQASMPPPTPPGPAVGIVRTLPATARVGEMAPPLMGTVQIDGQIMPLSPSAQIRNQQNLIVMPGSIQQPVRVRYIAEASGAVWRVWILTPAELAAAER
jgi:hypothetical protein